jgi:heme-degrading monooxygenase HmoA
MILEIAEVYVQPGTGADFEKAVSQGQHLVMQTPGYINHELQRSIEDPTRYMLLIHWESVAAHEEGFRQSDRFPQWREYIGPFFAKPPFVQHFEVCTL